MVESTSGGGGGGGGGGASLAGKSMASGFISTAHAFDTDGTARLLIQVFVILCVCRAISFPFKFLRQPAVIAEVIGGIVLGPTALGRWTWFRQNIFPTESLPVLNVLANFGLLMFLLLMGLELDLSVVAKRARTSLTISLSGIFCTFILSIGISRFFFELFPGISEGVDYPKLLLFIGVAMSVTAFPVLARILTERKLLKTPVGISVISAAAVDDAFGWMALALVIALIQATSPLTGLYIFLTVFAFAAFMFLVVRPALARLHKYLLALRNQNANRDEVSLSQPMVLVAFLITFAAAFFTSAVGIHAIFGAFITGLILPREDGFAVKLTEKLEELTTVVLLPLYFTYSGLKTNIGAINTGISVAGFMLVLLAACCGKIGGCSLAARFCGLNVRESFAVGILMNTKGLVEIIILNIGLDAGLINDQVFAVMVLLAIFTTCLTTPLITWVYPESYYSAGAKTKGDGTEFSSSMERFQADEPKALMLCLPNTASVASMMSLLHDISHHRPPVELARFSQDVLPPASGHTAIIPVVPPKTPMPSIHAVRLRQLSDRMSTLILAANEADGASWAKDPSLTVLRTFGLLRGIGVTPHVLFTHARDYAKEVAQLASETDCDTIVVPWRMINVAAANRPELVHTSSSLQDDFRSSMAEPKSPTTHNTKMERLSALFGVSVTGSAPPPVGGIAITDDAEVKGGNEAAPLAQGTAKPSAPAYEMEAWIGDLALQLLRKARVKVAVLVDRTTHAGLITDGGEKKVQDKSAPKVLKVADVPMPRNRTASMSATKPLTLPPGSPILVPFFGGPDDRAALQMALKLARTSESEVSVLHVRTLRALPDSDVPEQSRDTPASKLESRDGEKSGPIGRTRGLLRPRRSKPDAIQSQDKVDMIPTITVETQGEGRGLDIELVPSGYAVDPVDAEDAKVLSFALGADLASANIDVQPIASVPSELPDGISEVPGSDDIEPLSPTTTSRRLLTSSIPARIITAPWSSHDPSRPKVTITEVMSVEPLSTCIEILRRDGSVTSTPSRDSSMSSLTEPNHDAFTPRISAPSLVIVGHFGPTWKNLAFGAGVPDRPSTHTMPHHQRSVDGTQWSFQHATFPHLQEASVMTWQSGKGGDAVVGVEEKVLGPTGKAIVAGLVGKWNVMVVRKIRIDARLKEV